MFGYENFDTISTRFLTPVTRVVEFVPRGIDGPYKVLSLSATARTISTAINDGYVDVGGRVEFKLVYLDFDGAVSGASYNADFNVRLDGEVCQKDDCLINISAVECEAKSLDALTLCAVIKVDGIITYTQSVGMLTEAENSFSTTSTISLPKRVACMGHSFVIDEETSAKEIDKILSLDTKCGLTGQKVSDKRLDLTFDTTAVVTFVEEGVLRTATFNVTSEECVDCDDLDQNDKVFALPYVKSARIVLSGVTGENTIRFEGEIGVNISITRQCNIDVIDDVFSLTHDTEVTRNEVDTLSYSGANFFKERVFGQIDLPSPCALVAVPASTAFVAKSVVDNGLVVEGVATVEIIYQTEDGLGSARAEVPFSLSFDGNFDHNTEAYLTVLETAVKIKGTTAEIALMVGVQTASYTRLDASYISSVELGLEKEINRAGLSLYVADEGDGLWEVCKALTATPKEINEQNPNLNFPLRFGEKVLYFRRIAK
jgi:hypothetical protein